MKTLNSIEVEEDIKFLKKKLVEKHPNPFRYLKKKDFFSYIEELKNTDKPMSLYEFGMKLSILLSRINDGHTGIGYSEDILGSLSFPIRVEYIADGYYVVHTTKKYLHLLGSKLLCISNFPMEEVEKLLSPIISIENEVSLQCYIPMNLFQPKILNYFGITEGNKCILTLEKDSKVTTVKMSAVHNSVNLIHINETIKELDWTLDKQEMYRIKDLPDLDTTYFQYNECEKREDYKMSEVVRDIKKYNRKNLIIDLRDNMGGDSDLLDPLTRYIKRNKNNIKVYVLVNVKTYSSAIYNLVQLAILKNVVTLGEIPHGNPTHYGQPRSFTLPNSKIQVFVSTKIFIFKNYKLGESFKPDIMVSPFPYELLNGKDTLFKYLIENIIHTN
ncbi:MAG: S41 family peptidase [Candidatus Dojkabacteria bacterium]|jgi:hypothetical protein